MMHRLDPIRIQMRGNRLHALPLARQQQPGAIAVQPLFLLGMVHRCGERIHVFVELLFFTALTTLCAHALNIETSAAPSARQAMRVSGKLPLSDVCYSRNNSAFLFGNQNIDNMIWTFAAGVPIWTAYEVLTLWAFANHYIPYVSFAEHPVYCATVFLLIPVWR